MSRELHQLLSTLAGDPAKLATLTMEQEQRLLASLSVAVGEVSPGPQGTSSPPPVAARTEDDLLTVEEAAATLRVSPRWLYRHAKTLPFSRKLSRKVLRFSRAGIARWLATKRL